MFCVLIRTHQLKRIELILRSTQENFTKFYKRVRNDMHLSLFKVIRTHTHTHTHTHMHTCFFQEVVKWVCHLYTPLLNSEGGTGDKRERRLVLFILCFLKKAFKVDYLMYTCFMDLCLIPLNASFHGYDFQYMIYSLESYQIGAASNLHQVTIN
jgi:hypothetical protein